MEFLTGPNVLLEALAYLGRRAAGYDAAWVLERLQSRGVVGLEYMERRMAPISALFQCLDDAVPAEASQLCRLFGNLPGFPYNTIGSYSPAFLLLYPIVTEFGSKPANISRLAQERSPERLAGDLAMMLDIGEDASELREMPGDELSARVLTLSVPAESKVALLELYHHPETVLDEALPLVEQVIASLQAQTPLIRKACAPFFQEIQEDGLEAFLSRTSALNSPPERNDQVRPFLFGMDTLLAATPTGGRPVQVFCGILRLPLQTALASARGPEQDVYNAIKLLADQTRFDILCYLRDRNAYGQELAAKFGLSRNTIHHHMTKLLAAHLVKCTVDGNRVYYTMDRSSVSVLLDSQRRLLLPEE